jgi:hypothetical protein
VAVVTAMVIEIEMVDVVAVILASSGLTLK